MIDCQEIDFVSKVIDDVEQMGYVVVRKEGYLQVYLNKDLGTDFICLIYNQEFLCKRFDLDQPMHYIALGQDISLSDWGVCRELVSRFEYPFFERLDIPLKVKRNVPGKIFYVLEGVPDKTNTAISLSVIKSFNCLLHLKFYCVVPDFLIPMLEKVANDNIIFLSNTSDYATFFPECDLLIGNESTAAKGILSNIPVIVVGKHGFGGLVTKDNLISFLLNRFSGRPGGHLGERISPVLVLQEINFVLDIMNTGELDDLVDVDDHILNQMKAFCGEFTMDSIKGIISEKCMLREHIHDGSLFQQLKPKLSSDIAIDKIEEVLEDIFFLRNVNTYKILATMSGFEANLILECRGENRVMDLPVILGEEYDINDCVEFLRSLWELRAIHFVVN